MPLVRYYSTLFQDQLQAPYIGDVLERIGGDHNQIGISRPYAQTVAPNQMVAGFESDGDPRP
jgi:hypothetical protein